MRTFTEDMNMYGEDWRDVAGTSGNYKVSNLGRVITKKKDRWVLLEINNDQNLIRINGQVTRVPYLVLEAFVGPRPAGAWCSHIDRDGGNNRLMNLEWTEPRNTGRMKLTEKQVYKIRRGYESGEQSIYELAKRYKVSKPTIYDIIRGNTWKWVP